MTTLKLTTAGDLDLSTGNLQLLDGNEEIAQKLKYRLQFFFGEWFLDQRLGIPYYEDIFIKNPDLVVVQGIFREVIIETPGVVGIVGELVLDLVAATRLLTVAFSATLSSGGVINFNEDLLINV